MRDQHAHHEVLIATIAIPTALATLLLVWLNA